LQAYGTTQNSHNTYCPTCQHNRTLRERPYGELQPIWTVSIPYHTIAMDFILALPVVPAIGLWKLKGFDFFDSIMTQTCKASRKSLLLPGYSTYTAKEWATLCVMMWLLLDWGIPRGVISDRDRKFLLEFWRGTFQTLGTKLLYSTAWHPQTDGALERKNQTVEIALQYQAFMHPTDPWSNDIIPCNLY
jgi:hypothetical protein